MHQPASSLQTKQASADYRGPLPVRGVVDDAPAIGQRWENQCPVLITAPVAGQSLKRRNKGSTPGCNYELVVCFNDSVGSPHALRRTVNLGHLRTGMEPYIVTE